MNLSQLLHEVAGIHCLILIYFIEYRYSSDTLNLDDEEDDNDKLMAERSDPVRQLGTANGLLACSC